MPTLSSSTLPATEQVKVVDASGTVQHKNLPIERPLTLKVDGVELVTLMTIGTHPELLALGYLRNQRLISCVEDIKSITVDWQREHALVCTHKESGVLNPQIELGRKIVTTGCGQGTVFSCSLNELYETRLTPEPIKQSTIYDLLRSLDHFNAVYKSAGAVHGCALCEQSEVAFFTEDVGRHNATDVISGKMWLDRIEGQGKIFYTTGRLTSEMVMKSAFMGIPTLISRSGVTLMGLELARNVGLTIIARAKGKHFLIYHQEQWVEMDQKQPARP